MAQVDVQWPSEDEDFDAVSQKNNQKKTATNATKVKIANADEPTISSQPPEEKTPSESVPKTDDETASEQSSEVVESGQHEPDHQTEPELDLESQSEATESEIDPQAVDIATRQQVEETVAVTPVAAAIESPEPAKSRKGSIARTILEVILVACLVGLGLWSWTLYSDNQNLKRQVVKLNADPQFIVKKQTDELIAKVGKLIDLPKNEIPTVANVSDAAAARKQSAFFNNAQNGDRVLLYTKAGQAILYRPSTDKIILVAPLTFTGSNTPAVTSTTPATTKKTTP